MPLVHQFLKKKLLHWIQSRAPEFQTFESKLSIFPVFIVGAFDPKKKILVAAFPTASQFYAICKASG